MITGLVVGKFLPPHRGHKFLIDTAQSHVDKLYVLVVAKQGEFPPALMRMRWISEIHPQAHVYLIRDINDDDNSEAWAKHTQEELGLTPDIVFTSEDYGEPYARALGCKHVLVDKERKMFPIHATQIRESPMSYWDFLEPCVRMMWAKRIVVLGAESSGTTTLSKLLAMHYKTVWVPEYGREYSENKMMFDNQTWQESEFYHIATEQNRREDAAFLHANRVLICDTNSFATSIWCERYMGKKSNKVNRLSLYRPYDLTIITDIDIPFIQDGTRDGEGIRTPMHKQFIKEVKERKFPYIVVSGTIEQRMEQATKKIDSIIGYYLPPTRMHIAEMKQEG